MVKLILIYVVGVLVKWGWESFDWVGEHRSAGFKGWWTDQKIEIGKKAFMHVFLCPGWLTGILMNALTAAVGAVSGAVTLGGDASAGVLPINAATTLMAAFVFDSIGKPLMRRLKRKEADA